MRPGRDDVGADALAGALGGDLAAQPGEGGLRRVVGRDAAAGGEPGDRRDEHDRAALGHHARARRRRGGSATARSPRTRGPTARRVVPCIPMPAPMPTLHTSPSRPSMAAAAASTRPRARVGVGDVGGEHVGGRALGLDEGGGGLRGVACRCRRTRPWRRPGRRATAMARPLPIGASGSADGLRAGADHQHLAPGEVASCRAARGSRRTRARRRASSASWRRGGTGPTTMHTSMSCCSSHCAARAAQVASLMRLSAWSSSAARSSSGVGVGPAVGVGPGGDARDLLVGEPGGQADRHVLAPLVAAPGRGSRCAG